MITLYIDTTSNFLHTALLNKFTLIDKVSIMFEKDLSKYSLKYIDNLLNKNNLMYKDINKIVVVNGPGSFTGIRIGLTIAKTLAWAYNIPIVPISSLKAISLSNNDACDYVIPIIDARHEYVYAGIFDTKKQEYTLKEQYISLNMLDKEIKLLGDSEKNQIIVITNDNIPLNYNMKKYTPDFVNIIKGTINDKEVNPHLIDANYLKKTEAEEKKYDS